MESSDRSRLLLAVLLLQTPCGSDGTTWPALCLHSLLDPPFCEGGGAVTASPSELPISPAGFKYRLTFEAVTDNSDDCRAHRAGAFQHANTNWPVNASTELSVLDWHE